MKLLTFSRYASLVMIFMCSVLCGIFIVEEHYMYAACQALFIMINVISYRMTMKLLDK